MEVSGDVVSNRRCLVDVGIEITAGQSGGLLCTCTPSLPGAKPSRAVPGGAGCISVCGKP